MNTRKWKYSTQNGKILVRQRVCSNAKNAGFCTIYLKHPPISWHYPPTQKLGPPPYNPIFYWNYLDNGNEMKKYPWCFHLYFDHTSTTTATRPMQWRLLSKGLFFAAFYLYIWVWKATLFSRYLNRNLNACEQLFCIWKTILFQINSICF